MPTPKKRACADLSRRSVMAVASVTMNCVLPRTNSHRPDILCLCSSSSITPFAFSVTYEAAEAERRFGIRTSTWDELRHLTL